ncbi:MAG: TIR domain-containing protein [Candidatus Omnitrophota bacterium]|nr:TIR domain-containing protein [Candidatus Omnitrophota bacterium]
MATKKRVFISFDYDHDEGTKIMLAGQARLPDSPFDFTDASVKDHLTGDWKDKVRLRMDNIDVVVVLCGESTDKASGVAAELTIAQEKDKSYFHLAAYPDKTCTKPSSAKSGDKVYKWTWDNLKALMDGAR